ncbi:hypothetical protein PENCOP_c006G03600 [Penicillium coprophilum]|uniref:C2H2-type domain-containing protein n=1 Tax=Penicillium coprophilum TaxID=36646 RepID=A0A1V6UP06_9EURO|nr:hypothetical protein PENCOP_c006G03600 [Penicillium coprophilum]
MECPLCAAKFYRLQHLERHLLIHGSSRPYACAFCEQPFNRRDALKRHWRSCKSRLDKGLAIPLSPNRPSGRKKRACDRCSKLKRACDSCFPCETCLAKRIECSYYGLQKQTRLEPISSGSSTKLHAEDGQVASLPALNDQPSFTASAHPSSSAHMDSVLPPGISPSLPPLDDFGSTWWSLDLSISSLNATWGGIRLENEDSLVKFDFLASFTSANGFANSFRCGTLFQRQQIALMKGIDWEITPKETSSFFIASNGSGLSNVAIDAETSSNTDNDLQNTWRWDHSLNLDSSGLQSGSGTPCFYQWAHHPLALKTQEVIDRIKETVQHKPRNSFIALEWSNLVENTCLVFFSPPNLCKFLRLFWSSWYPNCPIIHRPTFDPLKVPPSLLSSMVIIGACLSPDKSDNQLARAWFNPIEEMVFNDQWLEEDFTTLTWTRNIEGKSTRLQALQAAYFVCLFQNWEGSDINKRRIRRHRYNTLIAIARDLEPASINHLDTLLHIDEESFEWGLFIETEEKIRFVTFDQSHEQFSYSPYSTLSFIFLLDGGFVIFNNMPPRMVVAELQMSINGPDECFQALTATECFAALNRWAENVPHHSQYSIASVLETMFQPDLPVEKKELYAHFGNINLFILVTALHTLVFQLQNAMAPPEAFRRIENALQNWRKVWAYRRLSLCHLDDAFDGNSLLHMWKRTGFMKDALEFWLLCNVILERIRPADGRDDLNTMPGRVLKRFDETNMKQVNDLMKQFENFSLSG